MNWLQRLFGGSADRKNVLDTSAFIKLLASMGLKSKSGVTITVDRALGVSTVLACVKALAEGVSQIPIKVMLHDEKANRRTVASDHRTHKTLSRQPNPWMTDMGLRETMMYHAVLTGNAFAFKTVVRGAVTELNPIEPGNVKIIRVRNGLTYEVSDTNGVIGVFGQDRIFHLRGPSWDGHCGLEIIRVAREAIGLAIATEENHAHLHANGSKVGGILTTVEKDIDDALMARIQVLWEAARDTKYGTAILGSGIKYEKLGMSGVDTQHIQTREHQVLEICRSMGVFPMIIGFADKTATFASAEAFFTAHVKLSLGPWVRRWEGTCNTQLLTEKEFDSGYYVKLFTAGLERGDLRARYASYQVGILTGFMTRNEARALEDLDPIDGLDEPLVPLNMGIAGQEPPDDGGAGPGGGQNAPGNRRAGMVVPKSVADALYRKMIGHNGGPRLDDDCDPVPADTGPRLLGGPTNVGRVLSAKNERKIREASEAINTADGKLADVLTALDKEPETEGGNGGA